LVTVNEMVGLRENGKIQFDRETGM